MLIKRYSLIFYLVTHLAPGPFLNVSLSRCQDPEGRPAVFGPLAGLSCFVGLTSILAIVRYEAGCIEDFIVLRDSFVSDQFIIIWSFLTILVRHHREADNEEACRLEAPHHTANYLSNILDLEIAQSPPIDDDLEGA